MLEFWRMRPGMVAPERVQFYGPNRTKLFNYAELNGLKITDFTFNSVFKLRTSAKLNCVK